MRRCGIDAWKNNDVPFGVRALQRGIEVEGVWTSRTNITDCSQVASSATLIGELVDVARGKDISSDAGFPLGQRDRHTSSSSTQEEPPVVNHPQLRSHIPVLSKPYPRDSSPLASAQVLETADVPTRSKARYCSTNTNTNNVRGPHHDPLIPPTKVISSKRTAGRYHKSSAPRTSKEPQMQRQTYIKPSRRTQRPSEGLETLPTRLLGAREDLQPHSQREKDGTQPREAKNDHRLGTQDARTKLRKKQQKLEREYRCN